MDFHHGMPFDDEDFDEPRVLQCRHCGSTEVRWRHQGGQWVLFSNLPGVVHECDSANDFD